MLRFLSCLFVVLCLWSAPAAAQSDTDRAAAQKLFDEAQALKKDGKIDAACDKFEKSHKLDPAVGTQLNLADCYERQGRTASAWVNYEEVSQLDPSGERRAKFARERADKLKPRLTMLRVEVPHTIDGMTITRSGQAIPEATWGTSVPVDPGEYEVVVKAPGKLPWRDTVTVEGEGEEVTLEIPALADSGEDVSSDVTGDPQPDAADEGGSGLLIAGAVVGGIGLVGIGVGGVLAGMAHSKAAESEDHCLDDDPNQCTQEGVTLREDAQGLQTIYIISFGVGGAAAIAGLVMILVAPSSDGDEAAWSIAPQIGPGYLGVSGTF